MLYFEAEKEGDLRKVGYSKERRVDPRVVVGLLVDRRGFTLGIGCYEGNKAETLTIVPIVKVFAKRHWIVDMVDAADAGMLSSSNLRDLDEAGLRSPRFVKTRKAQARWTRYLLARLRRLVGLSPGRVTPLAGQLSAQEAQTAHWESMQARCPPGRSFNGTRPRRPGLARKT